MKRAALSWSGGKDSALALQRIVAEREFGVAALITTITDGYDRISMHGVRATLLNAQCSSLRLPLLEIRIPAHCSNEGYESALGTQLRALREEGVHDVVFGDLFLQDIRDYREALFGGLGMRAHFPLWQQNTGKLARHFIAQGFRAVIVCVDPRQLPAEFCGREYDDAFLNDLPATCDPCGERGEFHTFVYDGPIFSDAVPITRGGVVFRDGFYFCDYELALDSSYKSQYD